MEEETRDNRRNARKKSRKEEREEEWIQKWVGVLCEATAGCGTDQSRRKKEMKQLLGRLIKNVAWRFVFFFIPSSQL
jgi:hypothetical protein